MKRLRGRAVPAAFIAVVMAAVLAGAQERSGKTGYTVIASVGALPVTREEFERRAAVARAEFTKRRGQELTDDLLAILDRQILESMIRANLLVLEARRQGVTVSDAEAEAILKNDPFFNPGGTFNPGRFQSVKTNDPNGYRQALERMRAEAAAHKLADRIEQKQRPEEARVRALAERALSTAAIEYLMLPRAEFTGEYPEPRESEILGYLRAHHEEFRRPARVVLSLVRVDDNANPGASKQRADSALARIRGGASLEEVAGDLGTLESGVVALPGNFPGYWRGSDRISESLFRQRARTVLTEPVPAEGGWLLVRIDESRPAGTAALREAAPEIRRRLRDDVRLHSDDGALRALYEQDRSMFRAPAFRIRYAAADTGAIDPGKPTAADLDRYYHAHLADYTSYDAATASISVKPMAEVRNQLAGRWDREQRLLLTRGLSERVLGVWGRNARDRNLERSFLVREVGPLPAGATIDTGRAGQALSDSLRSRGMALGVGMIAYDRGLVVYHVYERVAEYVPTFEEVRPVLARRHRDERMKEFEEKARARFDQNPDRYATGKLLYFSRISIDPPNIVDVPLTREEIARYHRDHIDRYSVPEQIRARHILISPEGAGAEADGAARRKAQDLLERVRAGEDFAALASRYSDDPPTRKEGGDLGFFARGTMLEPLERAAFAMKPGEVSDLIKSEVGYHIVKIVDRQPMQAEPLVRIYTNVGADAAAEKAQRMARHRADSLFHLIRTPADARALARRLNLEILQYAHQIGNTQYPSHLRPIMAKLETVPLGQLYPDVVPLKAQGAAFQWPDSIVPARGARWEDARARVLEEYAAELGRRTIEDKRGELDSLLSAGWSIDSVAALWGGMTRVDPLKPGQKLRDLGVSAPIDSLVFGGRRAPGLESGQVSGWLDLPAGLVRVRLDERRLPAPNQLASRIESERRSGLERNLYYYYEDLKKRYPVRITDARLRDVAVPEPPPENLPF